MPEHAEGDGLWLPRESVISHGLQRNYLSPLADQCAWSGGVLDRRGDSHYGRSDEVFGVKLQSRRHTT